MTEQEKQSEEYLRWEQRMTGKIRELCGKELELLQELYEGESYWLLGTMANGYMDLRSRAVMYMSHLPEWEQDLPE